MEALVFGWLVVRSGNRCAGPDGLGGRKPKQAFELLASARGRPVAKESLVEDLWGDHLPRNPAAALENHIWVLRKHLRAVAPEVRSAIVAEQGAYRLARGRVGLDIDRFDALVRAADQAGLVAGRADREAALRLARGDVFEDEPYAEWAASLRENYRAEVRRVSLDAGTGAARMGDASAALAHASRAMANEPLSERACRLRMWGHAAQGEREQAVRVFAHFRAALQAELRVEPLPETVAVYEQIRRGEAVDGRRLDKDGLEVAVR